MLQRIKSTIITLGLASGMTAAALFYLHNVPQCRAMVLHDMVTHQQFAAEMDQFAQTGDFLATLKRASR